MSDAQRAAKGGSKSGESCTGAGALAEQQRRLSSSASRAAVQAEQQRRQSSSAGRCGATDPRQGQTNNNRSQARRIEEQ